MKEIKLTQGKVALIDDADFDWLNQWKWHAHKRGETFYAARAIKRKTNYMHRIIMNPPKGVDTDHIDRNGLNCQRSNLRTCNRSQNCRNRSSRTNSYSQYVGVSYYKRDDFWTARIEVKGKSIYLGIFKKETDAALAYNDAAKKYHGEFANLNKVFCNPCIVKDGDLLKVA